MRAFFLIFIMFTVFFKAPGQSFDVVDSPTACDAVFSSNPDPLNPMIIHFQDQSSGQINHWQWSFGDGTTSVLQNPEHTYNVGGTYFVCLTVSNSEPGNICHDVSCVAITVHQPGTCVADYDYSIDPVDSQKIHFTDQSSGNINRWHWDFGDGSVSSDRNPIHVFPQVGKFKVCLTAYNADSVSVCNDVKCDSVALEPTPGCHARFTSVLDSMNAVPNTFMFESNSTGDPNKYHWSFDDGTTYDSKHVVHHFETAGTHQVCLVIRKELHGQLVCADSLCQSITTAKYFDLGGHLFAGDYPINNPTSTGDTGVAYLFRINGTRLIPVDTSFFTQLGYFAFPQKLNGYYIVKAGVTSGSDHYLRYFPSYFLGGLTWKDAVSINLSDNNAYLSDIHPAPTTEATFGLGKVSGTVIKANSRGASDEIPHAEVILYDAQLKPLLFTFSDQSGKFELSNLPYGAYYVSVEYPGKYARLTAVWLDATTQVVDSLRLEVFNHDVTGISDLRIVPVFTGDLFPNPATSEVSLTLEVTRATSLKFEIKTMTGITAWSGSRDCQAGSALVTIPLDQLRPGLFLFIIKTKDGFPVNVKKLVKF